MASPNNVVKAEMPESDVTLTVVGQSKRDELNSSKCGVPESLHVPKESRLKDRQRQWSATCRRVSAVQLDLLLQFLRENPKIANAHNRSFKEKEMAKNKWMEIAVTLNRQWDGTQKDWRGWCKYWVDYKAKIKKKASTLKLFRMGKVEGLPPQPLSKVDKKFLVIMKDDFRHKPNMESLTLPSEDPVHSLPPCLNPSITSPPTSLIPNSLTTSTPSSIKIEPSFIPNSPPPTIPPSLNTTIPDVTTPPDPNSLSTSNPNSLSSSNPNSLSSSNPNSLSPSNPNSHRTQSERYHCECGRRRQLSPLPCEDSLHQRPLLRRRRRRLLRGLGSQSMYNMVEAVQTMVTEMRAMVAEVREIKNCVRRIERSAQRRAPE